MTNAPTEATLMSMNSLNTSPLAAYSHASRITPSPTGRKAARYQTSLTTGDANQAVPAAAIMMPEASKASDTAGRKKFLSSIYPYA